MFEVDVNGRKQRYRSKPTMNVDTTGSSGNVSIPKPLTYDYMPEGYPKKFEFTGVLMEERSVPRAEMMPNPIVPIEGKTYTVTFDGANYECVCRKEEYIPEGETEPEYIMFGIGNPEAGDPFYYVYTTMPSAGLAYGYWGFVDEQESHTISVQGTGIKIKTISTDLLPTGEFSPYEPMVENTKKVYVAEYHDMNTKAEDLYNEVKTAYDNGYYVLFYFYGYNQGNNPEIYTLSHCSSGTFWFSHFEERFGEFSVLKLGSSSSGEITAEYEQYRPYYPHDKTNAPMSLYLESYQSQKLFEIRVDDSGTLSATEVT